MAAIREVPRRGFLPRTRRTPAPGPRLALRLALRAELEIVLAVLPVDAVEKERSLPLGELAL